MQLNFNTWDIRCTAVTHTWMYTYMRARGGTMTLNIGVVLMMTPSVIAHCSTRFTKDRTLKCIM